MNGVVPIDAALLDALAREARGSPRRRKNRNFHADGQAACHRLLNAVEPDSYIPPHRHLAPEKAETIVVVAGSLALLAFDERGRPTGRLRLAPGGAAVGADIPAGQYHAMVALEAGTVFFESKAGPYAPLTPAEQAPWAPPEGAPGADGYRLWMAEAAGLSSAPPDPAAPAVGPRPYSTTRTSA